MAPVRGDGMRGLAVFISDIRNCEYIQQQHQHTKVKIYLVIIILLSA